MKILLIEPDASLRRIMEMALLAEHNHVVPCSPNTAELHKCLRYQPFRFALVNYRQNAEEGPGLLNWLNERVMNCRFIVYSTSEKDAPEAFEHGAAGFLLQPFTTEDLRLILKNQMEVEKAGAAQPAFIQSETNGRELRE